MTGRLPPKLRLRDVGKATPMARQISVLSWRRERPAPPAELVRADARIVEARARVQQLERQVEDEMRRGGPATHARQTLALCQEILREAIVHRDAVFVAFMKRKPKARADATVTASGGGSP